MYIHERTHEILRYLVTEFTSLARTIDLVSEKANHLLTGVLWVKHLDTTACMRRDPKGYSSANRLRLESYELGHLKVLLCRQVL